MKSKILYILPVLWYFLTARAALAQVNDLLSSLNADRQMNLHEKLFVHTDKSFYLTGEILWLKIYDVDGAANKPLTISKTAYVEILDKANNPVLQAKIALNDAVGNGSLYIPVTLANGNYKLRAYTNWMKNFSPDGYFEKQISIVNPLRSPTEIAETQATNYDLQVFPEGGSMVAGVANKIAFRLVGNDGKSAAFKGAVINQRNDTLVRFQSLKFGIGSFMLTPQKGETYRLVGMFGRKSISQVLPAAAPDGTAILLTSGAQNSLSVAVSTYRPVGMLYLVGYSAGVVKVAFSAEVVQNRAVFNIDKDRLDPGITHFTVFDGNKQPIAERLYFKKPAKKLQITASTSGLNYGTRKKVEVAFSTQTADGLPAPANLSMAVFRVDSLQQPEQIDIRNYLWLTSELKGNIESPDYYFAANTAETEQALDNLLLTQGWRQFDPGKVPGNAVPAIKFLPEYNGHLITGRITSLANNAPAKGVVAYLGIPGKRVQLYPAVSDSAGILLFNTREMYGPGEIIVQTNTEKDSTYHIEMLSPFSEQFSTKNYPALQLSGISQPLLENYSVAMQVQNLYAAAKIKQFVDPGLDSSAFFRPYKTYKLDDFTRFTTMEEVLREYVTEVNILKSKNRYQLKVLGQTGIVGDDPLVMVDGIPVFNINKIMALDPLKVRKLDVLPARYFYGPTVSDGIFSFTTYKGDLVGLELDPRAVVLDYEGMQLQRKFYSPVYDTDAQTAGHLPDFRTLLYWQPNANTGANGKNNASFFTSDQPGKYRVVIQGITPNGEPGMGSATFEVR